MPNEPTTEIQPVADAPLARCANIETILGQAVQAGRTGAELKELLDVYERMQGAAAVQSFNCAMARFKAECPTIPRTRKVNTVTKSGCKIKYDFADLEEIAAAINPTLTACGLSYRWTDTKAEGSTVVVKCRVSHIDGHSEDTPSPPVPIDTPAGMSPQQKWGSATTYARRYALTAALGLSSVDPDDDGRGDVPAEVITEEQADSLNDLLVTLFEYDKDEHTRGRFLAAFGVEKLAEFPASRFSEAADALNRKIATAKQRADGT